MGFRYRRSVHIGGGFRINVSGSGVGYSWGVPGYRITKTATGKTRKTASIPGTGISYTTEESGHRSTRRNESKEKLYNDLEIIQSADRKDYQDSDFNALMKQIRRTRFINNASITLGVIGLLGFIIIHSPQRFFLTAFSFAVFFYVHYVAPVKLDYDFSDEQLEAYKEWYAEWRKLFACDGVFYVPEAHTNRSAKESAGAEKSVSEEAVLGMPNLPYYLKTNVPVFSAALNKKESIFVFPDKIFYTHKKKISAYDISEVSFDADTINYITVEGHCPSDSKIVGNTWLRVNADGTPDKRYKNNIPCLICEFGKLHIYSDSGLNVLFLLSKADNIERFKAILPQ